MGISTVIIILASLHLFVMMRTKYIRGIAVGVFYLVWLPHGVRFSLPGALPEFTVHRILLLVLLAGAFLDPRTRERLRQYRSIPLWPLIRLVVVMQTVSFAFAPYRGDAIKALLATLFENFIVYALVFSAVERREEGKRVLSAAAIGIAVASLMSWAEYYKDVNYTHLLIPAHRLADRGAAVSTYEHRIHTGYAMAMAAPILLVAIYGTKSGLRKFLYSGFLMSVCAASYFAKSRAPWAAMALAMGVMMVLGKSALRRIILQVVAATVVLLILFPGVQESLRSNYASLFEKDTGKGKSAQYRFLLWDIAYAELAKSSVRFAVGYGGLGTEHADISGYFEAGMGGQKISTGFSSWDSDYAATWYNYGTIGLVAIVTLQLAMFRKLFRCRAVVPDDTRPWVEAVIAVLAVYMLGQTNVSMFSPQLKYCLWSCCAAGLSLGVGDRFAYQDRMSGDAGAPAMAVDAMLEHG